MRLRNYKCVGCSAPISYNPNFNGFVCEYCGRTCTEEELINFANPNGGENSNTEEIREYNCPNCGAEVICGETTTASFCYYCHSPIIIEHRLRGDFKPDKIIPFKIDQNTAVEKFSSWISGKKFLPKDFSLLAQREKIIGLYLPYRDIDVEVKIDYQALGLVKHFRRNGNREEIIREKYKIAKNGEMQIPKIRSLSFDRINTDLINAINPFLDEDEKNFNTAYLSGFQAERHTISQSEAESQAILQAQKYTRLRLRNSAQCQIIEQEQDNSQYSITKISYILLPVYILNYKYQNRLYQFAVNGQTGVAMGDLPIDNYKILGFSILLGLIILILALLGGAFLW